MRGECIWANSTPEKKQGELEVNNVRYMTYPWTDPQTKKTPAPGLSGDAKLNYLIYLETIGLHTPPSESGKDAYLQTSMGNWTVGRDTAKDDASTFGTFILSSSNFTESFILPRFAAFNRVMSIDFDKLKVATNRVSAAIRLDYHIGNADLSSETTRYKLKKEALSLPSDISSDVKTFFNPLLTDLGQGAQVWTYKDIEYGNSGLKDHSEDGTEAWTDAQSL